MENKQSDKVVFYGPLTVNKPYPIIKPNDKIQLQPTINPVAIVPYISTDNENTQTNPVVEEDVKAKTKSEKRVSARICGILMFLVIAVTTLLFVLPAFNPYPISAIEKYCSLEFFINGMRDMFQNKQFTQFNVVFVPYLLLVGLLACAINLIMSLIALFTGKRRGYVLCAFITFLTFVIASFYQMKFFSGIKEITNLLSRPEGWACVMLIIIGLANLFGAFLCSIFCPKHKIVKTIEY